MFSNDYWTEHDFRVVLKAALFVAALVALVALGK